LNGDLDATYKGYIDENIAWALANDLKIILDIHNYGRRGVSGTIRTIGHADGILTQSHFASLWSKLATAYKDDTTVLAYGLMNEPHDMPVTTSTSTYNSTSTWTLAAQAAIDAIRLTGDTHTVIVSTDQWAGIRSFTTAYGTNPTPWINDSNYWLELHCYFDSDSSGTYTASKGTTFAGSGRAMGEAGDYLVTVATWARNNNIPVFVGEYGVPKNDAAYLTALNDFMNVMDTYGVNGTYWAMGSWYTSVTGCHPKQTYTDDQEQMDILVKHI
jgi:endoglucanase